MEREVANIITVSNLYETVCGTLAKVGYEFQAPLSDAEEQEVISREINECILGGEE